MIRRLFTIASALSLVLCVATCVLWVRSYATPTTAWDFRVPGGGRWDVRSEDGVFEADEGPRRRADAATRLAQLQTIETFIAPWSVELTNGNGRRRRPASVLFDPGRAVMDILCETCAPTYVAIQRTPPGPYVSVAIRYRWAAGTAVLLPALWVAAMAAVSVRRRRHAASGLCLQSGYDLRASPDRCPECGAVPAAKWAA
jgi:hypothetical protein